MAETTGTTGIWNGGTTASTAPTLPSGSGGLVFALFFWKGNVAAPTPDTPGDWDDDTSFTQIGSTDLNIEAFWTDAASPDMDFTFASAPTGAICVPIRIDDAATGGDIDVASLLAGAFSFSDPYDPGDISSAPDGRILLGVMRTFSSWDLGASTSLYSASNPTGTGFRLDSVDVEVLDADGTAGGGSQDLDEITRGSTGHIMVIGLAVAKAAAGGLEITPGAVTVSATPGSLDVAADQAVTPGATSVTVTPGTATVVEDQPVTPAATTITVAPGTVDIVEDQPITPDPLSVSATPGAPSIVAGLSVSPDAGAVAVTPAGVTVIEDQPITPDATTVTVAAGTVTITADDEAVDLDGITVTVAAAEMTITTGEVDITPDATAVTVTAQALVVAPGAANIVPNAVTIDATPSALAITTDTPITPEPVVIDVSAAELLIGFTAGADGTQSIVRTIVVASELTLEVTGTARTIRLDPQSIIERE